MGGFEFSAIKVNAYIKKAPAKKQGQNYLELL
jgi:hypothetical protein